MLKWVRVTKVQPDSGPPALALSSSTPFWVSNSLLIGAIAPFESKHIRRY